MTARPNDVPDVLVRSFERGLEAYLAADTITDVLEAVDLRALLAGENLEEPMEYERMGKVVGALVGRLVVRGTVGRYVPGRLAEQTVGYTVGGLVGQQAARVLNPARLDTFVTATVRDLEGRPLQGKHLAPTDRRARGPRRTETASPRTDDVEAWTEIPIDEPAEEEDTDEGESDDGSGDDRSPDDESSAGDSNDAESVDDEGSDGTGEDFDGTSEDFDGTGEGR